MRERSLLRSLQLGPQRRGHEFVKFVQSCHRKQVVLPGRTNSTGDEIHQCFEVGDDRARAFTSNHGTFDLAGITCGWCCHGGILLSNENGGSGFVVECSQTPKHHWASQWDFALFVNMVNENSSCLPGGIFGFAPSTSQKELVRIQHGPCDVLQCGFWITTVGQVAQHGGGFVLRW